MRLTALLPMVSALLLTGCVQNPTKTYSELQQSTRVLSLKQALTLGSSHSAALPGTERRFRISGESGLVEENGLRGNFEIIEFKKDGQGPVRINVQSLCDCFGFNKYVMVPKIFLADATGALVNVESLRSYVASPTWSKPASVISGWYVANLNGGRYKLLVMADNSQIENKLTGPTDSSVSVVGRGVVVAESYTTVLTAHPFGEFDLWID